MTKYCRHKWINVIAEEKLGIDTSPHAINAFAGYFHLELCEKCGKARGDYVPHQIDIKGNICAGSITWGEK